MKKIIIIIAIFTLILNTCKPNSSSQYVYKEPEDINDGLDVGSLEEVNIDKNIISQAVTGIYKGHFGEVHSILIYKDGKLVLEEYFEGHQYQWDAPKHHGLLVKWDKYMPHVAQSVTKSITATCIGIAIEQGFIKTVKQSIFDYLPKHQYLKTKDKQKITIENLLTMTTGLQWDEWHTPLSSAENDIIGVWFYGNDNPIDFILRRPLLKEPGTHFTYSGGNMHILGEIIHYASGMDIREFSRKYLLEPLGIDSYNWSLQFKSGMIDTASSFKTTPRGLLKIGITYLNKGVWKDKRIVSEEWVEKSSVPYKNNKNIIIPGEDLGKVGYAYAWWTKEFTNSGKKIEWYSAGGWGGQKILVIPKLNTVIVFTGGNFSSKVKQFKILKKYIIPSLIK